MKVGVRFHDGNHRQGDTDKETKNDSGIVACTLPFLCQCDEDCHDDQGDTGRDEEVDEDEIKDFNNLVEFGDWVLDFLIVCLCRSLRRLDLEEFERGIDQGTQETGDCAQRFFGLRILFFLDVGYE